ncbi:MAG: glycosyltransferase [Sporolactobacillus sp.]
MKILVIVGEFPKLSQTFILDQITGFINYGHDVTILAKQPAADHKVHDDVRRYRLQEHVVYYGNSRVGRRSRAGKLIQFAAGFLLVLPHLLRHRWHVSAFIKNPNLILMSRRLLRTDLTDHPVILAHFGPNGLLAQKCMDNGLLRGRLFVAFHGYDMLRYIRQKGTGVYHDLFHSEAILLPISAFWRERCLELGADERRVIVHHMGINLSLFCLTPIKPQPILQLVSATRLVEKKGLIYALEAVRMLTEKGMKLHYAIAGDGPLAPMLRQRIAVWGLENSVELLGWCTQTEWLARMRQAQFVLAPSVTSQDGDMEGIPVQLMEAMAIGRLVIATRHSGIPELIESGVNGWLVAERDASQLAEQIERVSQCPQCWTSVAQRAHETIVSEFNGEIQNARLVQLFEAEEDK